MADVREDAKGPSMGWDRECLQAARDRNGRRLGTRAAHRAQPGSGMRNEKVVRPADEQADDIVMLEVWKPAANQKLR